MRSVTKVLLGASSPPPSLLLHSRASPSAHSPAPGANSLGVPLSLSLSRLWTRPHHNTHPRSRLLLTRPPLRPLNRAHAPLASPHLTHRFRIIITSLPQHGRAPRSLSCSPPPPPQRSFVRYELVISSAGLRSYTIQLHQECRGHLAGGLCFRDHRHHLLHAIALAAGAVDLLDR